MFDELFGGKEDSPIDVLNKLLDPENIAMKSDFTLTQIGELVKIRYHVNLEKGMEGVDAFADAIDYYMQLKVSKGREGRKEIIEGIKEMKEAFLMQEPVIKQLGQNK